MKHLNVFYAKSAQLDLSNAMSVVFTNTRKQQLKANIFERTIFYFLRGGMKNTVRTYSKSVFWGRGLLKRVHLLHVNAYPNMFFQNPKSL